MYEEYSSGLRNTYDNNRSQSWVNLLGLLSLFQSSLSGNSRGAWLGLSVCVLINFWHLIALKPTESSSSLLLSKKLDFAFSLVALGIFSLSYEQPIFLLLAYLMAIIGYALMAVISQKLPLRAFPWNRALHVSGYICSVGFLLLMNLIVLLFMPSAARGGETLWEWIPLMVLSISLGLMIVTLPGLVRPDISGLIIGTLLVTSLWRMQLLNEDEGWLVPRYLIWALLILTLFGILSIKSKKIDVPGGITGSLIGVAIFLGAGFKGLLLLLLFFVMGTGASSWKMKWKQAQGLAEKNKGKRSINNALANGAVAAWCGLLAWRDSSHALLWQTLLAASFAAATADTLSSELGNVYGKRYIDILSWKSGKRGDDGVISLEGTLIGATGSVGIAIAFAMTQGQAELTLIWKVALAGVFANAIDSILGASLQRQGLMNNDTVNFANTLSAALFLYALNWF